LASVALIPGYYRLASAEPPQSETTTIDSTPAEASAKPDAKAVPPALPSPALAESPDQPLVEPQQPPRLPAPPGVQAMPEPHRVWIDAKQKAVLVDGYVSLNEGLLEMFACPSGTKEHESVVAVYSSAQTIHTALLAVGAKPGHPVQWDPKFAPPAGTEIEIEVHWPVASSHREPNQNWRICSAQLWLTDLSTKKPMSHPWVFAGSGFWKDEESGREYYLAEAGDLVCVSNFSSATLDVPIKSSQVNDGLLFEANTSIIPPIGTPVRLVLKPKLKKEKQKKIP